MFQEAGGRHTTHSRTQPPRHPCLGRDVATPGLSRTGHLKLHLPKPCLPQCHRALWLARQLQWAASRQEEPWEPQGLPSASSESHPRQLAGVLCPTPCWGVGVSQGKLSLSAALPWIPVGICSSDILSQGHLSISLATFCLLLRLCYTSDLWVGPGNKLQWWARRTQSLTSSAES